MSVIVGFESPSNRSDLYVACLLDVSHRSLIFKCLKLYLRYVTSLQYWRFAINLLMKFTLPSSFTTRLTYYWPFRYQIDYMFYPSYLWPFQTKSSSCNDLHRNITWYWSVRSWSIRFHLHYSILSLWFYINNFLNFICYSHYIYSRIFSFGLWSISLKPPKSYYLVQFMIEKSWKRLQKVKFYHIFASFAM